MIFMVCASISCCMFVVLSSVWSVSFVVLRKKVVVINWWSILGVKCSVSC